MSICVFGLLLFFLSCSVLFVRRTRRSHRVWRRRLANTIHYYLQSETHTHTYTHRQMRFRSNELTKLKHSAKKWICFLTMSHTKPLINAARTKATTMETMVTRASFDGRFHCVIWWLCARYDALETETETQRKKWRRAHAKSTSCRHCTHARHCTGLLLYERARKINGRKSHHIRIIPTPFVCTWDSI